MRKKIALYFMIVVFACMSIFAGCNGAETTFKENAKEEKGRGKGRGQFTSLKHKLIELSRTFMPIAMTPKSISSELVPDKSSNLQ